MGRASETGGRWIIGTTGWALASALAIAGLVACEAAETDLPGPAVDRLDGASPVPEELLPREGRAVERIAVSADGETVFGSLRYGEGDGGPDTRLVRWQWDGERWAGPTELGFTMEGDGEVAVAPDGSYLLFSSARQTDQIGAGDRNLWLSQWEGEDELARVGDEWSEPWMVPTIHSPDPEGAPTLSMAGNLYFSSERDDDTPGPDLYVTRLEGGMWSAPQRLETLSSPAREVDPWVAPDESFLLFASDREGTWDLYIAFSEDAGETWAEPARLRAPVVTDGDERAPALSPAGEVLFFTRDRGELWWAPSGEAGAERPM